MTPRFVAPHFVEIAGAGDLPGPVRRACAFTTAVPGWAVPRQEASHHHHCVLTRESGHRRGVVRWRTETRLLSGMARQPAAAADEVAEGTAPDLPRAIAAALSAAQGMLQPIPAQPVLCVAPAFVEMEREAGLPRIWVCAHLSAVGPVSAEQPWTEMQTAFIRERSGHVPEFQCTLERLPSAVLFGADPAAPPQGRCVAHWTADSLDEALRGCQERMFATRAAVSG